MNNTNKKLRAVVRFNMERLLPPRGKSFHDDGRAALARRVWPDLDPEVARIKLRKLSKCKTWPSDELLEDVARGLGLDDALEFFQPIDARKRVR
jgi:hypothetical protein